MDTIETPQARKKICWDASLSSGHESEEDGTWECPKKPRSFWIPLAMGYTKGARGWGGDWGFLYLQLFLSEIEWDVWHIFQSFSISFLVQKGGLNFCPFVFLGCLGSYKKKSNTYWIQHRLAASKDGLDSSSLAAAIEGGPRNVWDNWRLGRWMGYPEGHFFHKFTMEKWPILHMVSRTLLNIVIFHRKVINFMRAGTRNDRHCGFLGPIWGQTYTARSWWLGSEIILPMFIHFCHWDGERNLAVVLEKRMSNLSKISKQTWGCPQLFR